MSKKPEDDMIDIKRMTLMSYKTKAKNVKTGMLNIFFHRQSNKEEMKVGDLEYNNGAVNWWLGLNNFSLFKHLVVEEETAAGQDKITKETPWLVRIMTIIWLVCSMI